MCSNDAVHIFEIIEYITLFYICIIDIRKKIIPDRGFIILVTIGLLKGMINTNIEGYFLGMCVYPMPLIILHILEDYFKKELIGFGDIKLMMGIGGNMGYKSLAEVVKFYHVVYFLAGITVILFLLYMKYKGKKAEYIPFAPFLATGFIMRVLNIQII